MKNDYLQSGLSRRAFLGGAFATFGGMMLPAAAFGGGAPNLKLGVISDVHVSAMWDQEKYIEKALRWFDAQGVDAVMVPGDIAHSGLISELTRFANVWYKVFPADRGADGRHVEKLFVTGNHDLDAWWTRGSDEHLRKVKFSHGDNRQTVWKRLFHEEYQEIWKKEVKGYVFIGAQWPKPKPAIEAWFETHATELKGPKPFFFTQHAHPKGTCHLGYVSYDDGTATRALEKFPNAVAITGHSHQTLADDSFVWQSAFTSINAGCLRAGGNDRWGMNYDSIYPAWMRNRVKDNRMKPLAEEEGRGGLLIDVFDDRLVVHRRSFEYDMPFGEDVCLPLPASGRSAFMPVNARAKRVGPKFPAGARVEVESCAVAPASIVGPALKGKPCVHVKIPYAEPAKPGCRVYDYLVEMLVDGEPKIERLVLANGFNVPEVHARRTSNCLFGADEVPAGKDVRFRVTPRDSFRIVGAAITSAPVRLPR